MLVAVMKKTVEPSAVAWTKRAGNSVSPAGASLIGSVVPPARVYRRAGSGVGSVQSNACGSGDTKKMRPPSSDT